MASKRSLQKFCVFGVASLMSTACATVTDMESIKTGMSLTEAEVILGSPESVIPKSSGECRHYRIIAGVTHTPTKVVFYDKQGAIKSFGDYSQRGQICSQ